MIDLSFVQECVTESEENVRDSLDMIYIKNHTILEYVLNSPDQEFSDELITYLEAANPNVGSSKELSVYAFQNTHIIKAIKCFNKAYQELDFSLSDFDNYKIAQERGNKAEKDKYKHIRIYPKQFIDDVHNKFTNPSGEFIKGFNELKEQFNCKFTINLTTKSGTGTYLLRFPRENKINKITVSKTKGFQLDNLPIMLAINVKQILDIVPFNKKLFGQTFVGIILHEIYHNIVHCLDLRNKRLHTDIKKTFISNNENESKESIMSKIKSFISRFKSSYNVKDIELNDDKTENRLFVLTQISDNVNAMRQFEKDVKDSNDETADMQELDAYIKRLKAIKTTVSVAKGIHIASCVCAVLLAGIGFVFGVTAAAIAGTIGLVCIALSMLLKTVRSLLGVSVGVKEEYFCDLFAAMYKLPIHLTSYNRQIALNKRYSDKVSDIRGLSNDISKKIKDPHPETFNRELVSYRVAKQILDSGQSLEPEIRDYLQYIVNLHDGIEDVNVPYSKTQARKLDPEAAKDLQKTLDEFVRKSGVSVTESFVEDGE
jgi:hypothetical protein